ncbi:fused MFS/spermidine synthase [Streptomyces sp. SID3343]|uniref:spermidine synthase n=1 Tax=Streptomyces sp. SID3343 TaxID=2690260 RepID=UPI00136E1C8F|nr:fused MFS/spermidine synthase [Streptomyces sp. SID3343]MYW01394.1 methyltransferase domain-containing protein [Streptomyces sp. SID3343]
MADKQRRRGRAPESVRAEVGSGDAVLEPDPDRSGAWTLHLHGAPQSHVDLGDPTWLEFEYVRRLGHVVDLIADAGKPLRVLHLGGGGLTLARYVAATRPRSRQQVAELDAGLVEFVRRELPLAKNWQIRVRTADAREVAAKAPEAAFDLVVVDVFADSRVPAHLTSVEFVTEAARALAPGGVYAVNLADGGRLDFVRSQVATVRSVFPNLLLIADPAVLRGRRFGNVVLVASHGELPIAELSRRTASDPFPGRVEHGSVVADFPGGAAVVRDACAVASPLPPERVFGRG